jgi:uncharacterized caspase-like protein
VKQVFAICRILLVGLLLSACGAATARAETRVALVIGNANYRNSSLVLANPKNDAQDVAAALRGLGFSVIEAIDVDRRQFDVGMANFARIATDADTALFYYAGHAIQYQGRNYLMPVDAEVQDEVSLQYQLVAIDNVRGALDRSNGVKIMILDACRNNPIVDMLRHRSSGDSRAINPTRGLARMDKTQGMVIAYSTSPDDVAADGTGRNSPFTAAFLKWLKEPGLEVEKLFRRIAFDVNAATDGRQRPETYVSLLSDYYLNQLDRDAYAKVRNGSDVAALKDFLRRFPSSDLAPDARARAEALEAAAEEKKQQQARLDEAARVIAQQKQADAVRRQLDEQLAKLAAERAQIDRDITRRQQDDQRAKQAALEKEPRDVPLLQPEKQPPPTAPQKPPVPAASAPPPAAPQKPPSPAASTPPPAAAKESTIAAREPTPPPSPAVTQSCDQDQDRLMRLRGNPSRDEIVKFERELSCERLRPQLVRLRESLPADEPRAASSAAPAAPLAAPPAAPSKTVTAVAPATQPPVPASPQPITEDKMASTTPQGGRSAEDQEKACKRDEIRLAQLRANPGITEISEFERTLECEKLRPQVARLRESLPAQAAASQRGLEAAGQERPAPAPVLSEATRRATPKESQGTCEQDMVTLSRLRNRGSRDQVVRFEQQLSCESLRPQVSRLLESLPEN